MYLFHKFAQGWSETDQSVIRTHFCFLSLLAQTLIFLKTGNIFKRQKQQQQQNPLSLSGKVPKNMLAMWFLSGIKTERMSS